jgi:hypothetical protein
MALMRRVLATPFAILALALLLGAGAAQGELGQAGNIFVSLTGRITPQTLPRLTLAPVTVEVEGGVGTFDGASPPPLRRITIAINRHGRMSNAGLSVCPAGLLESTTSEQALERCGPARVGYGTISANVVLPQISPFPAQGRILAFNGRLHGKPVILAHIYGANPVPTTFVLPFSIHHPRSGTFGTMLSTKLPPIAGDWGYVKNIELTFHRRYRVAGQAHSFLSANCPVPQGFPGAAFTFARGTYEFANGQTVSTALTRVCRVKH